jgi:hypothetical protein
MLPTDFISLRPFLWSLLQVFLQLGQILLFCRFVALAPLRVDPLNRRVQCVLRRFEMAAARGDVRVIQEQLHRDRRRVPEADFRPRAARRACGGSSLRSARGNLISKTHVGCGCWLTGPSVMHASAGQLLPMLTGGNR